MTPRTLASSILLAACALLAPLASCDNASSPVAPDAATTPKSPTTKSPTDSTTTSATDAPTGTASSAAPTAETRTPPGPSSSSDAATPPAAAKPDRSTFGPLVAVFEQPSGSFRVDLATRETPRLCANFVNLCERGYYDGRTWGDFSTVVRQTGPKDPAEDPAYTLAREFAPKLLFDVGGNLCMSNTSDEPGARARATRIFITVKPQDRWNLVYPVFGRISSGLDIAQRLTPGEAITRIRIEGNTAPIKAAYAAEIAQWNRALDAAKAP